MKNIAIVIPVFNDWKSAKALLTEISSLPIPETYILNVFLIDDCSNEPYRIEDFENLQPIQHISIIRLKCNLGHQKAIAIGLYEVNELRHFDGVMVMDSDGEDKPSDIVDMLEAAEQQPNSIICASRGKRSESLVFRFSYICYKSIFRILTGEFIDFGNFVLLPKSMLTRLLHTAGVWNHIAASILRSRINTTKVTVHRGNRYFGKSKMRWSALIVHALNAVSVYADVALARILFSCFLVSFFSVIGMATVVYIRFFTSYMLLGWASTMFGFFIIFILLSFILATVMTFQYLAQNKTANIIPSREAPNFISDIIQVY